MKNDCLFCAIAGGEIPSNKVYEDELCYASVSYTHLTLPTIA